MGISYTYPWLFPKFEVNFTVKIEKNKKTKLVGVRGGKKFLLRKVEWWLATWLACLDSSPTQEIIWWTHARCIPRVPLWLAYKVEIFIGQKAKSYKLSARRCIIIDRTGLWSVRKFDLLEAIVFSKTVASQPIIIHKP